MVFEENGGKCKWFRVHGTATNSWLNVEKEVVAILCQEYSHVLTTCKQSYSPGQGGGGQKTE